MRTTAILAVRLIAVLAVCGPVVVTETAAQATPRDDTVPYRSVTFGDRTGAGVSTTVREQLNHSRSDRSRGASSKAEFLRHAATLGRFYDAGSIDYLRFDRTDGIAAEVVVPNDYRIDTVEIGYGRQGSDKGNSASAMATGGEIESASLPLYPSGPGFETYANVRSGSYQINVYYPRGPGKLYLNWSKFKDQDTTHPGYELWLYKRWAVGTPSSKDTLSQMGMRSYPTSSTTNVLMGWHEMAPMPGSYSGNCVSGSIDLSIGNIGVSFEACQSWRIDWNDQPWNAGDMSFNWSNGAIFIQPGAHNMAALFAVKTFPGTTPYYKDFFKAKFYAAARECMATDTSANCYM